MRSFGARGLGTLKPLEAGGEDFKKPPEQSSLEQMQAPSGATALTPA